MSIKSHSSVKLARYCNIIWNRKQSCYLSHSLTVASLQHRSLYFPTLPLSVWSMRRSSLRRKRSLFVASSHSAFVTAVEGRKHTTPWLSYAASARVFTQTTRVSYMQQAPGFINPRIVFFVRFTHECRLLRRVRRTKRERLWSKRDASRPLDSS